MTQADSGRSWWRRRHWPEYGAELLGTALMVFFGLSAVVFDFYPGSPLETLVPGHSSRLLVTGLLFAGCGSLVAISPLGRLSGAHINPSVTVAFWLQGKLHLHDLCGYVVAQFSGAILGAWCLVQVWGERAAAVNNGMTLPGDGYSLGMVFGAEVFSTLLLVIMIFLFVSHRRLMRWTPLMAWLLIATMVWLEAPVSGTSLNAARSFGPALVSRRWDAQWIYWLAPLTGSVLAVIICRLSASPNVQVLTGKLFHVPHYRCIFRNVGVPHAPPGGRLRLKNSSSVSSSR